MEREKSTKLIFKPTIARRLLKGGCQIVDIKPNKEDKAKTVFVFKIDENFKECLSSILKDREEHSQRLSAE